MKTNPDCHTDLMVRCIVLFLLWGTFSLASALAQTDSGVASYYGDEFEGRPTASGELYDSQAFTAAHRTLRFGIRLEVTNPANGRTVTVRVNDRGPFVEGRILDLSKAAAAALGILQVGTALVEVRVLKADEAAAYVPPSSPETFLQLGAFRTEANAQALARSLMKQGYSPKLKKDGALYRVYLTSTESELTSLVERLAKDGRNGFLQVSREPEGVLLRVPTE